jgi:hypothetical protein
MRNIPFKLFPDQPERNTMYDNNRPLEHLAAFAISFAAGAVSMVALGLYSAWLKKRVGTSGSPFDR